MIGLQDQLCWPRGYALGQVLNKVKVFLSVQARLFVAHACLAQEVHAEAHAVLPHLLQGGQGACGIGASNELGCHAFNLAGHGLCHQALGQSASSHTQFKSGRRLHSGLREIVREVFVDGIVTAKCWEAVNEPEQLDAECFVLHGPVHELVFEHREAASEDTSARVARGGEVLGANLLDALLKVRITGCGAPCRRCSRCGGADGSGLLTREKRHAMSIGRLRAAVALHPPVYTCDLTSTARQWRACARTSSMACW